MGVPVRGGGLVLAAVLLGAGCTPAPAPVGRSAGPPEPPGVVLLLRGSAFEAQPARDEAVRLVTERSGRPARVIAAEPEPERVIGAAAGRLDRSVARAASAEAKSGGCRKKGRAVATAVAERAETIVRIDLDAKVTARPATDVDRKGAGEQGLAGVLSAVGLGNDTVYEAALDGTVERTTFPGSATTVRQRVRWRGRRLGRKGTPPPVEVGGAIAQALGAMPPAAPARWDALARGLVAGGCPVLASAVADGLVDDAAAHRRVRASVMAALGPKPEAGAPPVDVAAATPELEPVPDAAPEPAPVAEPAPTPAPAEPAYSCATLCTLHMVELCNNDRTLWTQHGSRYENTRCGLRRSEPFLEDCYRMQWLSGTYEESCVRPCQENADGRMRLLAMLRRSGCLRAGG